MTASRIVGALVVLVLAVSSIAVIELAAMGAGALWLVLVTVASCVSGTWLGWDASKPPR